MEKYKQRRPHRERRGSSDASILMEIAGTRVSRTASQCHMVAWREARRAEREVPDSAHALLMLAYLHGRHSSTKPHNKPKPIEARIINITFHAISAVGFSTLTLVDLMYKSKLPIEAIQYLC